MTVLHNKVDKRVLREALAKESFKRKTISFYRYFQIEEPDSYRNLLFEVLNKWIVFGRIYVAKEGINAQISIPEHHWEDFVNFVERQKEFEGLRLNLAIEDDGKSFYKLTIKVRDKIVADGLNDESFDASNVGNHLDAEAFNKAIENGANVVDMRNHYESEVGHFKGAICPDSDTFKDELPMVLDILKNKEDEKVLLYCTGGIRCEKASAYLKHKGFKDVNQLYGGIIHYAREIKEKGLENKFIGKNFVFDERLGERISSEVISSCHQCELKADTHTNCKNEMCHILFIQCEKCKSKFDGCCSEECQKIHNLPLEDQKILRKKHLKAQSNIYKKGRLRPKL